LREVVDGVTCVPDLVDVAIGAVPNLSLSNARKAESSISGVERKNDLRGYHLLGFRQ